MQFLCIKHCFETQLLAFWLREKSKGFAAKIKGLVVSCDVAKKSTIIIMKKFFLSPELYVLTANCISFQWTHNMFGVDQSS